MKPSTIIAIAVVLLVVAGGIAYGMLSKRDSQDQFNGFGTAVIALLVGCVFTFPWVPDYHIYRTITGTVDDAKPRLLGGRDQHTTETYAVRLTAGGVYRCDDTRCALLKHGDTVSLRCIKHWQWIGTPGDVCSFRSYSDAR